MPEVAAGPRRTPADGAEQVNGKLSKSNRLPTWLRDEVAWTPGFAAFEPCKRCLSRHYRG
jgi:hypothetical protein